MDKSPTILVADRNANIRAFLERELMAEGYDIRLAKCGREVLKWAYRMQHIGLIILDLATNSFQLGQLHNRQELNKIRRLN